MTTFDIHITAKEVQKRVEHETVEIGKFKFDAQGTPLLNQFIMDADCLLLFRTYFREACTKILDKCRAYTHNYHIPAGEEDMETDRIDEDFFITLTMPDTFPLSVAPAIDRAIYNALIAFTVYRWFELKLPQEAIIYRQRFQENISELRSRLESRIRPVRRPFRPF